MCRNEDETVDIVVDEGADVADEVESGIGNAHAEVKVAEVSTIHG